VKEYHLLNPVIVDCTSSQAVADQYADFLREGFHVVTPNKKANTSSGLLSSAAPCGQQLAP
jgi:aspartokinase/homoserine dehydrogenase 1